MKRTALPGGMLTSAPVRGLRPGRYLATAIESLEQNRHYSPEFQKELRRGAREFTVREGETRATP